jgi:hypothetical protein
MEYTKPEVAVVGRAIDAIQGHKGLGSSDNNQQAQEPSISAYEADE